MPELRSFAALPLEITSPMPADHRRPASEICQARVARGPLVRVRILSPA